jgi:hypothetical protein
MSYALVEDLQNKAGPQVVVVQAYRVLALNRSGCYGYETAVK